MYTQDEREGLRCALLERARCDSRILAAAITGSAAEDRQDEWSDIDLAFAVGNSEQQSDVVAEWTTYMQSEHAAVDHVDVRAGAWLYRVFLLSNTLQVDLAFTPEAEFRALAASFRLVFGESREPRYIPPPDARWTIGMAWLHALHARSCLGRGRLWQAEYMISAVRDHALALAALRHGLPAVHGRGFDSLPAEVVGRFKGALITELSREELRRAFGVVMEGLIAEIDAANGELGDRLRPVLGRLE